MPYPAQRTMASQMHGETPLVYWAVLVVLVGLAVVVGTLSAGLLLGASRRSGEDAGAVEPARRELP